MNQKESETLSVVVERELPYPPGKVWRALTQPHLIQEWLMNNDFQAAIGHRFNLTADWGRVDCRVETLEPEERLSYTWDTKDLRSTVTWILTETSRGTHLRMEQVGFRPEQQPYYRGAQAGWPRFLSALESVLQNMDGGVTK